VLYLKPESDDASFHFAVEEYLLEHSRLDQPIFMIWQTRKTAMVGLYQVVDAEVDRDYAQAAGIQIVRRQSGGGTIFTDLGTLLYTLILPQTDQDFQQVLRERLAGPIAMALGKLGIPAVVEGRNDILVAGKKVSGLAQYVRRQQDYSNYSLLYNADLNMLASVLQVDEEKIRSKVVRSVRSRVTNLREHLPAPDSTLEFWGLLEKALDEQWGLQGYTLSETDLVKVREIYSEKYANPKWTFGRDPKFTFRGSKRFPAGKVEVYLEVAGGGIRSCAICGDFLGTASIRELESVFEGLSLRREAVAVALSQVDTRPYLGEITREQLLSCVFD